MDIVKKVIILEEDRQLLIRALKSEIHDGAKERIDDMLHKLDKFANPLTHEQRSFVRAMLNGERYEKVSYENLWSSGKVPKGKDVTVQCGPKVLRPPGRSL
jgi:hypothetical protein